MTTARDLCVDILKMSGVLGVGQTPLAEDINDILRMVNMMMAQWSRKRWLVYHLVDLSFVSDGTEDYSIGPASNFSVAVRPDRIESAFARQLVPAQQNPIDYQITILESREDYNLIGQKTLQSWPQYLYYDAGFPIGTLKFWPVPQSGIFRLFVTIKATLQQFTNLSDTVVLPPEYEAAIIWNGAARARPMFQLPVDEQIVALAIDSLNLIRGANAQIPRLMMPPNLGKGALYNIYGDQIYG